MSNHGESPGSIHPGITGTSARLLARPGRATVTAQNDALLQIDHVSKQFYTSQGSIEALHDVSFQIRAGEFVSILGPSGCGKSTLLDIIAGLQSVTAGTVLVRGNSTVGHPGHVGYMPQKDLLLPWRTVLDNSALGLLIHGASKKLARAEAQRHFPRFGLEGFEHEYPSALSGGMKRRAALLRTVLHGRDILLLDEPFGGLDSLTRLDLQEWLTGIYTEFRKTILLVTHDVDEALYLSDRVLVMGPRPGTVVQTLHVQIARPRHYESCVTSQEFLELKRIALTQLRRNRPEMPS